MPFSHTRTLSPVIYTEEPCVYIIATTKLQLPALGLQHNTTATSDHMTSDHMTSLTVDHHPRELDVQRGVWGGRRRRGRGRGRGGGAGSWRPAVAGGTRGRRPPAATAAAPGRTHAGAGRARLGPLEGGQTGLRPGIPTQPVLLGMRLGALYNYRYCIVGVFCVFRA